MQQKLQYFPTKKIARAAIGSLSNTSKMPGSSWGISPSECKTGSKLAQCAGSVCSDCYACKGNYTRYKAQMDKCHSTRLQAWRNDRLAWCQAMVDLITGQECFRWFDAGDLQPGMLGDILAIAARTPATKHWVATREVGFVRDTISGREIPPNVVIRMSASFPDSERIPGLSLTGNGALVHTVKPADSAFACPAPEQGGACGDCRACWNRDVALVSYKAH